MAAGITAIYDACVLYPAPLRDLLLHLAVPGLVRARWTDRIHDEWTRNLLANRPDLTLQQLRRTRDLMNAHVLDCLVHGYEAVIDKLTLPDADDRHVLAAAIHARADVIVTYNLKDFPTTALTPFGIKAQHPDAFVARLLEVEAPTVFRAAKRQREFLKNPPKTVEEFLAALEQQQLVQTVAKLREHQSEL